MSRLNEQMIMFTEIIEKIKDITKLDKDKELAELLNATPENFSRWKTRNSIPYEQLIDFADEWKINLNWLLLNKGEKYINNLNPENNNLNINLNEYSDSKEIIEIVELLKFIPKKSLYTLKTKLIEIKDKIETIF